MLEIDITICLKKTNKKEIHEKIQKKSFQHWIQKMKKKNELKSVQVDVLNNFIKDEVQSFSDAEVYTDDDGDSEEDGSLDLAKIRVASNRILVVSNELSGALKTHLKEYFFLGMNVR